MKRYTKRILALALCLAMLCGMLPMSATAASGTIPADAKYYNGHYYRIYYMEGYSWSEAQAYCESLGGYLATITNASEQHFIEQLNEDEEYLWLGGYRDDAFNWYWVTGETWNYTCWDEGMPDNYDRVVPNENRLMLWPLAWNDLNENNIEEQFGFVCEWGDVSDFEVDFDKRPVGVPSDALYYNGHYYYIFDRNGYTWDEARAYCQSIGGYLATITTEEEQEFIWNLNEYERDLWIGGYRDLSHKWYWVTGEAWSYTCWGDDEPNDSDGVENRAMVYPYDWNDACESEEFAFICEWGGYTDSGKDPDTGVTPEPTPDGIPAGAKSFGGHYYYVYYLENYDWSEAKAYCESVGGHLASVTSEAEQLFLEQLNTYENELWLGGYCDNLRNWKWVTGEPWTYSTWEYNQPDNDMGIENRLVMWPLNWNDCADANEYAAGFICEWGTEIVPSDRPANIPFDAVHYNNSYYRIFNTDTYTWEEAKAYCESMGGHLATITSADERGFIRKLNGYQDYLWLGGYCDTNLNWHWITGEAWDYTSWDYNQPDNYDECENCLMLFPVDWNDANEEEYYGFVCEWDDGTSEPVDRPSYVPADAVQYNGNFYRIYPWTNYSWSEAEAFCEMLGGHLATITDADEQQFIEYLNHDDVYGWLGGYRDDEFNWYWVTGEKWDYTNWDTAVGQPDNADVEGREENRVVLWPSVWNDLHENNLYDQSGFVCEWESDGPVESWRDPKDPRVTKTYNGHTYSLFDYSLTWTEAKAFCEEQGGYLVTVTSADEQALLETMVEEGVKKQYWLGASLVGDEFQWVTGESFVYDNWEDYAPDRQEQDGRYEDYMQLLVVPNPAYGPISRKYAWNDMFVDNVYEGEEIYFNPDNIGFICEWGTVTDEPADRPDRVDQDAQYYNGSYYKIIHASDYTWQEAQDYCESVGGHLATITSAEEQTFIEKLNKTEECLWLGGHEDEENVWYWITGEKWGYSNWEEGEPNDSGMVGPFEDCLVTWPLTWNDLHNDNTLEQTGFICEWDVDVIVHTHKAQTIPGVAPTCTEDGLTEGSRCSGCGIILTERKTIPATGHTWGTWVQTEAPGCTESGSEQRVCKTCGEEEERSVNAVGHVMTTDKAVAATCTKTGLTEGSHCTVCGYVSKAQEVTSALGHNWGDWVVVSQPNCTHSGEESCSCTRCGETKSRITEPTGHSYRSVVTQPTCTEQGYTTHTCTVCGASYVDSYVDPTGHSFQNGKCKHCGISDSGAILWGDANGDGNVDNVDAMMILQYAVGLNDGIGLNLTAADVDGSGTVDNVDAMMILQYAVGLITRFPVEK